MRKVELENNTYRIQFDYDKALVNAVRELPNRKWDAANKVWTAPNSAGNAKAILRLVQAHSFETPSATLTALQQAAQRPIGTIELDRREDATYLVVHMAEVDWAIVSQMRDLRFQLGGFYERSSEKNYIVADDALQSQVLDAFVTSHPEFQISDEAERYLAKLVGRKALVQKAREQARQDSEKIESDYEVEGLGLTLRPFQRAGVEYAVELAKGRAMIADEQGLGKTIQALATVHARDSYPLVVVCPPHLKENWEKEVFQVLGNPSNTFCQLVSGRKPRKLIGKVIILNYEIVSYHLEALKQIRPMGLVIDESQAVKNPRSARTKAITDLAKSMPADASVLLLSGTPVPNRPYELISQLEILGTLKQFGGAKKFIGEYVGWNHNGFGYDMTGAREENLPKLNEMLREIGYVRRRKADVLTDLPPIQRSFVPVELTDRAEYVRAREALRKTANKAGASKAELQMFRQLTASLKLESSIKWIETFLESDEKLIVFAYHKKIQQALVDHFPDAAKVLAKSEMSAQERVAAVNRFQNDDDCKLIICSLEVANSGLTLTAASNVCFIELGWTPMVHEQAEARCYGRVNDAHGANAYYLLAKDTADEYLSKLIERKRKISEAIVDGAGSDEDFDVEHEFLDWLKSDEG